MIKRFLLPLALLCICIVLFGCNPEPNVQQQQTQNATESGENATEPELPPDGYYLYQDSLSNNTLYMHLQDQEGALYMMNLPIAVTLQDGKISADGGDGVEYTYKNDKITFEYGETKISLKYLGETLEDKYKPIMPPAGTYAVSSISVNGDMEIYGAETDEILELAEDGTGTFYFAEKEYAIQLQDSVFTVDGEPIGFSYYPESGESPILMLLWSSEEAYSIALRPVTES